MYYISESTFLCRDIIAIYLHFLQWNFNIPSRGVAIIVCLSTMPELDRVLNLHCLLRSASLYNGMDKNIDIKSIILSSHHTETNNKYVYTHSFTHSFILSAFKRRKHTKVQWIQHNIVNIKRHVALSLKVFCFVDCYFLKVDVHVKLFLTTRE